MDTYVLAVHVDVFLHPYIFVGVIIDDAELTFGPLLVFSLPIVVVVSVSLLVSVFRVPVMRALARVSVFAISHAWHFEWLPWSPPSCRFRSDAMPMQEHR